MSTPGRCAIVEQIINVIYLSNHILVSDRNKLGSDAHNLAVELVKEWKNIMTPTCQRGDPCGDIGRGSEFASRNWSQRVKECIVDDLGVNGH